MKTCPSCGMGGPSIKHIYAELAGSIKDRHSLRAELEKERERCAKVAEAHDIEIDASGNYLRCPKCGSYSALTYNWWTATRCMNCKKTRQLKRSHGLRKRLRIAVIRGGKGE